jgi:hypothetical protein
LMRVSMARMVNRQCGGAVVTPWDVDKLPQDWLDVFRLLETDGERKKETADRVAKTKAEWLKKFKHYRM